MRFRATLPFQQHGRGYLALEANTGAFDNTAVGGSALVDATGGGNTAVGAFALLNNTSGNSNTAVGRDAGFGVTTANNVICIGHDGANESDSCYIGNIFGRPVVGGNTPVLIDANGKLGTVFSSRRFKHDIKPMDKGSEAIWRSSQSPSTTRAMPKARRNLA